MITHQELDQLVEYLLYSIDSFASILVSAYLPFIGLRVFSYLSREI